MNLKYIITLVAISFILFSCKTPHITDLIPENRIDNLLPALEPHIDITSLESAYTSGTTKTSGIGSSLGHNLGIIPISLFSIESTSRADRRIHETITLFDREVKDKITNPIGENKGFVVLRIAGSNTRASKKVLIIPSLLSSYTLNIIGMPAFFFKTELDIEVEIRDLDNNLMGRYRGYGKKEVPVALYYGYRAKLSGNSNTTDFPAARKSNTEAFKRAMNDIKSQISRDYYNLSNKLK